MLAHPPPPFHANMTKIKDIIEEAIGSVCYSSEYNCKSEMTTLGALWSHIMTVGCKESHPDGLNTDDNIDLRSTPKLFNKKVEIVQKKKMFASYLKKSFD